MFGVPEAFLSDRGTNLLSYLMQNICKLLGVKKLNTTAHHPQCNGMVEQFKHNVKVNMFLDMECNETHIYLVLYGPLHSFLNWREAIVLTVWVSLPSPPLRQPQCRPHQPMSLILKTLG